MIYDEAPYDILYYDANLDAYRTDQFAGWQNQPLANGTPLFTYGILDYTLLTDAAAQPVPSAVGRGSVRGASAGASAAADAGQPSGDGGSGLDRHRTARRSSSGAVVAGRGGRRRARPDAAVGADAQPDDDDDE